MHNPDELQSYGARCVAAFLRVDAEAPTLTTAERCILILLLDGHTNAGIGAARGTSLHTVANQIAGLLRKFELSSRAELMARVASFMRDDVQREWSLRAPPVASSGLALLTARELQVVSLRARGLSVKFISYELGIASSTVSTRIKIAMQRLKLHSSLELFALFGPSATAAA
jgi:DNA-binding NarL/FixJ family response regulator